jgi:transketolase
MKIEIRDSFVQELTSQREGNDKIMVLVSDSTSTCRIAPFMERFPQSLINVGIAEQNLVGMAAGFSLGGYTAITANAAPFLFGRSNEQVKIDICYSETNVKLIGLNPGFAYGSLGPTHHCLDDISIALSLGNIRIFCPCDPEETKQITSYAINSAGPVYIRLDSFQAENIHSSDYVFNPGEPVIIKKGKDITLITLGTIVHEVLLAAEDLAQKGIDAEIISLPSIRPLVPEKIISSILKTGRALTIEEHSLHGGLGSIISEIIVENRCDSSLLKSGIPAGSFAPASPRGDIRELYKLDRKGIVENALTLMKED